MMMMMMTTTSLISFVDDEPCESGDDCVIIE